MSVQRLKFDETITFPGPVTCIGFYTLLLTLHCASWFNNRTVSKSTLTCVMPCVDAQDNCSTKSYDDDDAAAGTSTAAALHWR